MHFLRHLPDVTPEELDEMAAMNPKPPAEIRQEIDAERQAGFLIYVPVYRGGRVPATFHCDVA